MPKDIYQLESYQFHLPAELIAQYPAEPRDESRLLVVDRQHQSWSDSIFKNITAFIQPGDAIVLNHTRVIPARIYGYKSTGAQVEILLLRKAEQAWEALVKPAKRLKVGSVINFAGCDTYARIKEELPLPGGRLVQFVNCPDEEAFLASCGKMPLPPYINREAEELDKERYQTVFAAHPGSAAAPTAGLHFTDELLLKLEKQGTEIINILLHVGLGTFRPVNTTDIRDHQMHHEYYEVTAENAAKLNQVRARGNKIFAVGTTVVRTLETVYNEQYGFQAGQGDTNIFIFPGYQYKAVDKLITNFHLPGSSLMMLVTAFAGYDLTMQAYQHAVASRYRFFSYGDAMLIL